MKRSRRVATITAFLALCGACLAATPGVAAAAAPGQTAPRAAAPPVPPAPQALAGVCLDAQTDDTLTQEFAHRLMDAIAASDALSLAPTPDACHLQLHVPDNLLRFEGAGGVMVSTVVIVTSPAGHYLSASITACRATDLKPCATRAVAVAKLALLMTSNDGT